MRRALVVAAAVLALAPAARADWNGDGNGDVLAVASDGRLLLYAGNGAGGFAAPGTGIGTGWGSFTRLLWPGDFSGDGRADVLAVAPDGRLLLYRGNGSGGFTAPYPQIGAGWAGFTAVLPAGDFSGDGKPDLLARRPDGVLLLYRGNGAGGWVTGKGEPVGSGWQSFTAVLPGGDFSGDGRPDVLARRGDGTLSCTAATARAAGSPAPASASGPAGARSRRSPRAATSAATAAPTCSPASPTAAAALPRQRHGRLRAGHRRADRQRAGTR